MKRTKNIFDKISALIPGYSGYAEREGRRNCDKILREKMSSQLYEVEHILYDRMNESLKRKDKAQLKALEEVRKQINTFGAKVKFAPYGATGFFSDHPIKEEELYHIYQIDLGLAEVVAELRSHIASLSLSEAKKMMTTGQNLYQQRSAYINEFK